MEFIAMTGCLSVTKRSSGNFLRDFKGVGGQGWGGGGVRTRGGCSYGPEVDSVLWWEHRRIAPVRGGGLGFAPGAGAPTVGRGLVSASDQSRSSSVTVMSWRDTSTFQKV